MKKIFGKTFIMAALCALFAFSANAQTKVGLIDLRKVFDEYYKTKQASARLKSEVADLEKQIKGMVDDMKKGEDEWKQLLDKSNDQAIAAEERDKSKQAAQKKLVELKDMEQTITQFQRSSKVKLEERNRITRDSILQEIKDAVNVRAKSAGYAMVIDSAASSINDTPIVMFTNGENDLTESILTQLNAGAPVGETAPKAGETK